MLTNPIPSIPSIRELETTRLKLRQWRAGDAEIFAKMNADADVMRYFAAPLERAASDNMIASISKQFARYGWGLWAIEVKAKPIECDEDRPPQAAEFIGFVGLSVPQRQFIFSPCVEIGWRLAKQFWGQGFASEAAEEALRFGFAELALAEIVSFTCLQNAASRRVMEKIGMCNIQQDFDHPALPSGHVLQRHCLYVQSREAWLASNFHCASSASSQVRKAATCGFSN